MATDYKKINEKSRINLRSIRDQRGDKTHFVYELVQNADDSKSKRLELHLCEKELLVWNDGCKFREEDVLRISSIGFSDKDLTQIGNFGTGFKAVYNYTDRPEVYSGDERFCLPDPTSISKTLEDLASSSLVEGIDKVPPRIAELLEEGRTVFRLPLKENLRQEDLTLLRDQLRELLKKRPLLFLPHLETIQWHDMCSGQTGTYCRCPDGKIQSADQVELKASMNGEVQESEKFLVFSKKFQPRPDVIHELLQIEYDPERRKRMQETAEKAQPIEVAFKLQDDKIVGVDNCVLFAYLSTEKETHLRFFIQARYQTNPARNDIEKTEQNPWNRWLVEETAKFFPEILEELKEAGLLEPAFFNVLPVKGEVENDFKPIAEAARKAMRERLLVPTQDGGYAKAENVFYPHRRSLRKLVKCSWIYPNSSWLHPDIGQSGRAFDVMQAAGVKEIDVSQVLNWLEKQASTWFEGRCEKWLCSLYIYLNTQKSELERIGKWEKIKKLPLVRLENGRHVCASEAFFPPKTDEEHEEIALFLNQLPILQSALLEGEDHNDIKDFLNDIGVEVPHPKKLINQSICPLYSQSNKPSIMENRRHVRYIFKSWQKVTESERSGLEESISGFPILRAYKGIQRETSDFVVPCNAYLPQAYTGDDDLETYFSVYDGDLWFVDDKYLTSKSDPKAWIQFLKAIGSLDTPRVIGDIFYHNSENCQEFNEELTKRNIKSEYTTRWWETSIKDLYLCGLPQMLDKISKSNDANLSRSVWQLLVKIVNPLPSESWWQNTFFNNHFQGIYRWFYRTSQQKYFDAKFYRQLQKTAWLPDEQGNLHSPDKCFVPTSKNQEILGDSVTYVHSDFDMNARPAQWLAQKLGVRLEADADNVFNYLRTLSQKEASIEKIEPLYRFLYDTRPRREVNDRILGFRHMVDSEPSWRAKFKKERLIFIPEPKPHWWSADEVFWEDEGPVFGDARGYLKAYYSEDLVSFFTTSLKIPKCADTLDYIRGIQDITSKGQSVTKEIRDRIQKLYRRLWLSLQENEDSLEDEEWQAEWAQIHEEACWLGKKGNEWGFFSPQELVWKDDDHRSELFKNEIPFWTFGNGLLEFAKELGVKGCYQDSDLKFSYCGNQEEDIDWSAKVRNLDQDIYNFLHSPHLCGEREEEKSAEILTRLSVCRVEKLEVKFELKEISVPDPNPRQSFLEETDQEATLWLASEVDEDQYAWLIGDALQEYFGDVKELGSFVDDLLTKDRESVLTRWKQKGLHTNIDVLSPEADSKEIEEDMKGLVDGKLPDESGTNADTAVDESDVGIPTDGKDNDGLVDGVDNSGVHFSNDESSDSTADESEHGTPKINENPEIGNGDPNSKTKGSGTGMYNPLRTSSTSRSSGHSLSTSSNKGSGGGGHRGSGGGGESDEHRQLKERLATNTSEFDAELKLVEVEHTFGSGDRVDILLKDDSETPVTVEVETGFSTGPGRYVGVWQAVKYQHLAAMECGLPCEQVRSILAAPEIPDDVKEKCKELGIEPLEVSQK